MNNTELKVPSNKKQEKLVYTARELMALGDIEQQYLLKPILPKKGCAVLVGKPDTGKSQFARQLCIQVALGNSHFLGFDLTPSVNKAIYVATEDDRDSVKFLANKQFGGMGSECNDNLRFLFADTLDQKEIIEKLSQELTKEPAGLVIVDSFGDIFNNNDSNNNMAMRNTVKTFDKIAKEHNCLILFVHHINKKGYSSSPGQEHVQGGSGLTQKVRLVIQLSEGDDTLKYLSVVKGNYCPKKYKTNSIVLEFSEETFLFENTGDEIQTSQIGANQTNLRQTKKKVNEIKSMESILGEEEYQHKDLVKVFMEKLEISEATAKRRIREHTGDFLQKLENGNYKMIKK